MTDAFTSWSITSVKRMPRVGKKIVKPRHRDMHMGGSARKKGKPPRGFHKTHEMPFKRSSAFRRVR